jgi:hypothetical protein
VHRLAREFGCLWTTLGPLPRYLAYLAVAAAGPAEPIAPDGLGALLPGSHRRAAP